MNRVECSAGELFCPQPDTRFLVEYVRRDYAMLTRTARVNRHLKIESGPFLLLKLRQLNTHTTGALFSMCNKLLTYDLLINNLLIMALLWAYSHIVTRERFQIAPSSVSAGLKTQCVMLLHAKKMTTVTQCVMLPKSVAGRRCRWWPNGRHRSSGQCWEYAGHNTLPL